MRRRGRPGLIGSAARTAARTAVVVGTANAMTRGRQRREARQDAMQASPEPMEAPPSGGLSSDDLARLRELADLNSAGILSDEEFELQKARILRG